MRILSNFIAASALAFFVQAASALPLSISYSFTDIADPVPGADRWEVDYRAQGALNPFDGFNVLFAPSDFINLSADSAPAGWSTYTLDPFPPGDGIFSATFDGSGSLPADFLVSFDWLGTGAPGSQSFEVFDANFELIGGGRTTLQGTGPNPVPEPGTLLLFVGGLAAIVSLRRKKHAFKFASQL